MPRAMRLDDASCAICMDTLFNQPDDLDEVMAIATPDCGHVFHEKCLLAWFRTQSAQYLAAARDQGIRSRRGASPTLSDCPAECPTCRTECYADTDTGVPIIHRLFINFGEGEGLASSSQVGSSPARWRGGKEREVMGLARRARNFGEEVKVLGPESPEGDVTGMMSRVEGLAADLVSIKALAGIKTYVGGLTAALNNFRVALMSHPLVSTLQYQMNERDASIITLEQQLRETIRVTMPRTIANALTAEQAKYEKRLKKVGEETDLVRRAIGEEQAARRAQQKRVQEREQEYEKKMAELEKLLEQEKEDRLGLTSALRERTKLMKLYQTRADSRQSRRAEMEDLRAKNRQLEQESRGWRDKQAAHGEPSNAASASISRCRSDSSSRGAAEISGDLDVSIQEIPQSAFLASLGQHGSHAAYGSRVDPTGDDSLQIDYPSFHEQPGRPQGTGSQPSSAAERFFDVLPTLSQEAGTSRSRGTTRTYSFDLDDDPLHSAKKPKTSRDPAKSKYFPDPEPEQHRRRVLIEASSSPTRAPLSPSKRSRTNPFSTSRDESERRKQLPTIMEKARSTEVIDLTTSAKSVLSPSKRGVNAPLRSESSRDAEKGKERSVADVLGLSDTHGRPRKGVVSGAKMKRRA